MTNHITGSSASETYHYFFTISVNNKSWSIASIDDRIKATPSRKDLNADILKETAHRLTRIISVGTDDGINIFGLAYKTNHLNDQINIKSDLTRGYAMQGPQPTFDEWLRVLWQGYATSWFLNQSNKMNLLPPWHYSPEEENIAALQSPYTCEVKRYNDENALPEAITYIYNSHDAKRRVVAATYRVVNAINYKGVAIPTVFVFERYGNEPSGRLMYSSYGIAHIAPEVERTEYTPKGDQDLMVYDYRFKNVSRIGYLQYQLTNGIFIVDTNDSQLRAKASRILKKTKPQGFGISRTEFAIGLLCLLVLTYLYIKGNTH